MITKLTKLIYFNHLLLNVPATIAPFTLSAVLTISINGSIEINKPMSVGEMNHQVFEQRQSLIALAVVAGVELPQEEGEEYDAVLEKFAKQYSLPRAIASRLCDEEGTLLFNADNIDDLNAIAELDAQIINEFNAAMAADTPKASASEESSK